MTPEQERAEIIANAEEACRQGIITLADLLWLRRVTAAEVATSEYTEIPLDK